MDGAPVAGQDWAPCAANREALADGLGALENAFRGLLTGKPTPRAPLNLLLRHWGGAGLVKTPSGYGGSTGPQALRKIPFFSVLPALPDLSAR